VSGKTVPVVESKVIGHTRPMTRPVNQSASRCLTRQSPGFCGVFAPAIGLVMSALLGLSAPTLAERDQLAIKAAATSQIQNAAAIAFQTPAEAVEVRLGDKRLVLPDCATEFSVSFPFNDRATTQLDCSEPDWRGFVQIRLGSGIGIFRYAVSLEKGDVLKRSHVTRHMVSADAAGDHPILVLDDVLDRVIASAVAAGEVLQERHFSGFLTRSDAGASSAATAGAWVARQIIPRGNRLSNESFQWEILEGRIPTDLIPRDTEFAMYEALKDIMPGDNLRRSAVKMAPSVRKNEEIEVSLVRGALTVTNMVRISRDATIGETIDVVNVESGLILKARVVGIGQVELL
jgi:flagella basal body P-ring formation protein FlgA